jgi:hypothetical protein
MIIRHHSLLLRRRMQHRKWKSEQEVLVARLRLS